MGKTKSEITISEKPKKLSQFPQHKTNPFGPKTLSKLSNYLVEKTVFPGNQDEGVILHGVDKDGQVLGSSTFLRTRTVDNESFLKLYGSEIKRYFELKPATLKVFMYILYQLHGRPNQDAIIMIPEEIMTTTQVSKSALYSSLAELCNKDFIARGRIDYEYYINPSIFYNGSRVSFGTTYINATHPDYATSSRSLKGTIDVMKMDKVLPQGELPFEYDNANPFTDEEQE